MSQRVDLADFSVSVTAKSSPMTGRALLRAGARRIRDAVLSPAPQPARHLVGDGY